MYFSGLLFLFIVLPMIELALLLEVGERLGAMMTFALVIFTGVVGATLARMEGLRVILNIQQDMARGRMPAPYLFDGLMILIAGALLITPGFMTDFVGFLLLVPGFRTIVKKWLRAKMETKLRQGAVDVTYWEW